ncbi:hypothetical protein B0J18DRAFT_456679 [Chaetomium sp. MPI-SDFR-AT-0129]|nr:hypothetical protein B0J18DRAFT_456679 [Chaetomium sp. MPI-SDFR-AT-0129]
MEKAAVEDDGLVIPLIDFSKFLDGTPVQKVETAKAILTGFQTAGFIYLSNIPIPAATVAEAFETSAHFFRLPTATKESLSWTTPQANRGYSAPGREKVSQLPTNADVAALRTTTPDIKESFEIGRDNEPGHPNRWPTEDDTAPIAADLTAGDFRQTMSAFFASLADLHKAVMGAIAVGMDLSETHFDPFVDERDNTLRLLHYPAVRRDLFRLHPGQVRAGEHSDYGSITFLFQDQRGGLQVQSPNGKFVDATPIEGTCVVNAGDLLARWSNDTIKSTVHRVVEPPRKEGEDGEGEGETYPARYSIAYFCNPNFKDFIEAIPGTYATEADKKYEGINSGEYLVQRLEATY